MTSYDPTLRTAPLLVLGALTAAAVAVATLVALPGMAGAATQLLHA